MLVLLPLEATTGYLECLTDALMSLKEWKQDKGSTAPDFLKILTRPLTESIVKVRELTASREACLRCVCMDS